MHGPVSRTAHVHEPTPTEVIVPPNTDLHKPTRHAQRRGDFLDSSQLTTLHDLAQTEIRGVESVVERFKQDEPARVGERDEAFSL